MSGVNSYKHWSDLYKAARKKAIATGVPQVVSTQKPHHPGGFVQTHMGQWSAVGYTTTTGIQTSLNFFVKAEDKPKCGKRRGGPRSKIYCEVYKDVPHDVHWGRTRKWYSWRDKDEV